jgi:hypothetical protein
LRLAARERARMRDGTRINTTTASCTTLQKTIRELL